MASALRGSRPQGRPGASCQAQCRGLRRAGRRGVQCHLAARRPGRSGRPGWAGGHRRARRRGAAGVRVKRCPRLCAPAALQPGPARAYLQPGRSRKSGAATHMQIPPGRRGGHTPPRPRRGSHVHPRPGLSLFYTARVHACTPKTPSVPPDDPQALARSLDGCPPAPRSTSGLSTLGDSPARSACGPRVAEHTGNLATVTLRQPRPAENRLAPGCALKPLALQIRIHFSQHEKSFHCTIERLGLGGEMKQWGGFGCFYCC